jgi:hypothetical protein
MIDREMEYKRLKDRCTDESERQALKSAIDAQESYRRAKQKIEQENVAASPDVTESMLRREIAHLQKLVAIARLKRERDYLKRELEELQSTDFNSANAVPTLSGGRFA